MSRLVRLHRALENELYGRPSFHVCQVKRQQLLAPAGVGEVVNADAGDTLALCEVEQPGQIADVFFRHREPEAHPHPDRGGVSNPFQRVLESASGPAELVVDRLKPVQADTGADHSCVGKRSRLLGRHQGAVGGKGRPQTAVGSPLNQDGQIVASEGLTAGEKKDRDAVGGQVVYDGERLVRRQLPGVFPVMRRAVAVGAVEVAAPGDVPHDDRTAVDRRRVGVFRLLFAIPEIVSGGSDVTEKARNA